MSQRISSSLDCPRLDCECKLGKKLFKEQFKDRYGYKTVTRIISCVSVCMTLCVLILLMLLGPELIHTVKIWRPVLSLKG